MRLKMCSIHVKDPAAAYEFYTGILGFESLLVMPEHNLFIVKDPAGSGGGSVGLLLEPSDNPIGAAYMNGLPRRRDARDCLRACPTSGPSSSGSRPRA